MPFDTTETDPIAKDVMDRWRILKSARQHHEQDWQDIDRLMGLYDSGSFTTPDVGQNPRPAKPLTSVPAMALQNMAAGLYGALINPATQWMGLVASDPDLRNWGPMRAWSEQVTKLTLASFSPSTSNFYSSGMQLMTELAGKGNAIQYDEEVPGAGRIADITLALSECVWEVDAWGSVIGNTRMLRLDARQAVKRFGMDRLPKKITDSAGKGSDHKFVFYHCVRANDKQDIARLGTMSKPWLSIHVCEEGGQVVSMRGYDEMPFYAPRVHVWPGQTYGMGYGHAALPAARVLDLMRAANLRGGQKAADPTLMARNREDWPLEGDIRPGEVIYNALDTQGRDVLKPLQNYAGTGLTLDMEQALASEVRDTFLYSLMSLNGRTGMTATEVMQIAADRFALMAPHMGRVQEEYLAPKVARRVRLLFRAGQLPPPPEGLPEGASLEVQYQSAAAMGQRAQQGASAARWAEQMIGLAQVNPRFADRIDVDGLTEVLLEAGGLPEKIMRSREAADQLAEGRAQQQQAMAAMSMAKEGAGIARELSQAAPGGAA